MWVYILLEHTLKCKEPHLRGGVVEIVHKMLINSDICGQRAHKMAGSEVEFERHSWRGEFFLFSLPKKALTNRLHHLAYCAIDPGGDN